MDTNERLPKRTPHVLATVALAGVALAAWAGWLGWDQQRDVHPDGSTTGPYEAWQVIGLVLTLLPPVYWAASRRYAAATVLGPTAGLTVAAYVDWSDDASGLYMVGVGLVMVGTLVVTSALYAVIAALTGHGPGRPGGRRWSAR